jgi:hypothetical protein
MKLFAVVLVLLAMGMVCAEEATGAAAAAVTVPPTADFDADNLPWTPSQSEEVPCRPSSSRILPSSPPFSLLTAVLVFACSCGFVLCPVLFCPILCAWAGHLSIIACGVGR